jgi:hypothetical protein
MMIAALRIAGVVLDGVAIGLAIWAAIDLYRWRHKP